MEVTDEDVMRPRTIDTSEYVKTRVRQIAELLEVVDNPALCPGEVTSGPRTVFQRLPRHMRRRAMSYNIKRLPRLVRPLAIKNITRTEHKKKPPSRIWRRRPSRILKIKIREQKKAIWLSTHIWHAKRFHMQSCWGYKLPIKSCDKSFRPNYRSSLNSAVIIDQSYLKCLQFNLTNECENTKISQILNKLSVFCQKSVSQTFSNVSADNENSIMLYKPGKFPSGLMGPAKVSICSNKLFLWIHPSMEAEFLKELLKLENFEMGISYQSTKKREEAKEHENKSNELAQIQVLPLRNRFSRFQLIGSNALALLHYVFKLVSNQELDALGHSEFKAIHTWWSQSATNVLPGNLRPGTQIQLLLEDPRLFRSQTKAGISQYFQTYPSIACQIQPPSSAVNLIWDWQKFQEHFLPKRLSHADFEKFCSGRLVFPQRTNFKVPVMVVISSSNNFFERNPISTNRITFICPAALSYDFWLAFQFANIRAIGLHDKKALDFEGVLMTFPDDCPDSLAGEKYNQAEMNILIKKHEGRPHNRRIKSNYQNGNSPFTFEWKNLFVRSNQDFFIIRNRLMLRKLEIWLKDGKCLLEEDKYYSNCLVPISLKTLSKGVPKRFASIYIPSIDDLKQIKQCPKNIIRIKTNSNGRIDIEKCDENKEMNEICEFLPLSGDANFDICAGSSASISKLVSLNDLFACKDKYQMKRERNQRKRKQKRENKQSSSVAEVHPTMEVAVTTGSSPTINEELIERRIVGRIVRGDYSFVNARGIAYGYMTLDGLKLIRSDKIVLVRNPTKPFYFPAKISIHNSEFGL